nr:hypothetical protein BaRGS_027923 [Batillaria attramentaria]
MPEGPELHLAAQLINSICTTLYLPEDDHDDISKFSRWLQCYYKPGMKNIADHNKRTMWYQGDPGPLVPREGKSGGVKKRSGVYNKKLAKDAKVLEKEISAKFLAAEQFCC